MAWIDVLRSTAAVSIKCTWHWRVWHIHQHEAWIKCNIFTNNNKSAAQKVSVRWLQQSKIRRTCARMNEQTVEWEKRSIWSTGLAIRSGLTIFCSLESIKDHNVLSLKPRTKLCKFAQTSARQRRRTTTSTKYTMCLCIEDSVCRWSMYKLLKCHNNLYTTL